MIRTKRAFTMIELIFVIVILGTLASIVIPRLASTRDDAEIARACANITRALSDMASYRVSQANFSIISQMTDIRDFSTPSANFADENATTNFKVGSVECLEFKSVGDGNISVKFINFTDNLCIRVKELCGKSAKVYKFGGSGVKM